VADRLTRAAVLRRGAFAGGALALGGAGAAVLAAPAGAMTFPDSDLANLRLLVGIELLALDYQGQALAGGKLSSSTSTLFKQGVASDTAHYNGLVDLLGKGNVVAATTDDIDFAYPKGSFDSESAILKLADEIQGLALGAYTGALENIQTPQLRLPVAQIAANEAQHMSALGALAGKPVLGRAFGPSLQIDAVTAALDEYES
jgi:hypothetical protein